MNITETVFYDKANDQIMVINESLLLTKVFVEEGKHSAVFWNNGFTLLGNDNFVLLGEV